jgi:hypothetical protein
MAGDKAARDEVGQDSSGIMSAVNQLVSSHAYSDWVMASLWHKFHASLRWDSA